MSEIITPLQAGFSQPVHQSSQVFRRVLEAMSHPGQIFDCGTSLTPPAPLGIASAAVLLALADLDTPIWIDGAARVPQLEMFLRFHTGAPLVNDPGAASFIVATAARRIPSLHDLPDGSDMSPELSCTLIVEADDLVTNDGFYLRGPGIKSSAQFTARGINEKFWIERWQMQSRFPRGIDIIFTTGRLLAAMPRTTRVEL